jgi:hypothetical protein
MIDSYPGFEICDFLICQCIRLGNDGNQVDLGMKSAHNLDVQWLQCVASGLDEVDTCMNTVVHNIHTVNLVLCI